MYFLGLPSLLHPSISLLFILVYIYIDDCVGNGIGDGVGNDIGDVSPMVSAMMSATRLAIVASAMVSDCGGLPLLASIAFYKLALPKQRMCTLCNRNTRATQSSKLKPITTKTRCSRTNI